MSDKITQDDARTGIQTNHESSARLLEESRLPSMTVADRLPVPFPHCRNEYEIDPTDAKRYQADIDANKDKLHAFKPSGLSEKDVAMLHKLQDALLTPGSLDGHEFASSPDKFIAAAKELYKDNHAAHVIVENLNASLKGYGIKVGHTTGEVSLMVKDSSGQGTNQWLVVHTFNKTEPTVQAFFTDERDGRFFPLDAQRVFNTAQKAMVKPPEVKVKNTTCDDRRFPPPLKF